MPFVNVRTAKGLLDEDQKRTLHTRLTDLFVEVEGRGNPDFSKYVVVLIEEHDPQNWSFEGETVTEEALNQSANVTRLSRFDRAGNQHASTSVCTESLNSINEIAY